MAKVKIKVLSKGDSVISVTEKTIVIQRKNGEVDVIPIISDGGALRIDTENIVTISYGNNSIDAIVDGDNGEVTITTF